MQNPTPKKVNDRFDPFIYPLGSKIKLKRDYKKRESSFIDVLSSRRSSRNLSAVLIEDISEILHLTSRTKSIDIDDYGFLISKRTVPSAGGRHPIDILVSTSTKDGPVLNYYNPIEHSLSELLISKAKQKSFFKEVNKNIPIQNSTLIWFSIQINKTKSKYENAESLYWKDAGAYLYCIQLVANYIGLNSCPLGGLAPKTFQNLFKSNNLISGGGILIG